MSNVHTSPTPVASDAGEDTLIFRIRPFELDLVEYLGTRSALVAEGCIPVGTTWPDGQRSVKWEKGLLKYELKRTRPAGMKGPMKRWIEGDYWSLRCEPKVHVDLATRRILKMKEELVAEIYRQSPEGQRRWYAAYQRLVEARNDSAFQVFKDSFIPRRRSPGRPPKSSSLVQTKGDRA